MPLTTEALAQPPVAIELDVDARWTMAYAAGVPDERAALYATDSSDRPGGVQVHPVFPVAAEWQLIIASAAANTGLSADEARRGIHIGHDVILSRPIHAGERIQLTVRTVGVGRRRAGATQTAEFTATVRDEIVWQTRMTSLYLGVDLVGEATELDAAWAAPIDPTSATSPLAVETSWVRPIDAHVYSECARIWNPIHTDLVAARRAGLDAPILHGTATLARSVSIATRLAGVALGDVRRVSCWFSGQVPLGSSFDVRLLAFDEHTLWFDAVLPDGTLALRNAALTFV